MPSPTDADPYEGYAALAAGRGLARAEGWWLVARPDAIRNVLESDACAVRPPGEPVPLSLVGSAAGEVFAKLVRMRDDAPRAPLKEALVRVLAEANVERAATRASSHIAPDRLLFDLAPSVLADLIGVPADEHPTVARAAARFARALGPNAVMTEPEALERAVLDLERWAARASLPGLDAANIVGLFFQAFDATAGLIGNTLVGIARDPTFRRDASERRIRAMVERTAAHDPSIHNTRRFVTRDVTIAGHALRRGDGLLVLLASNAAFAFGHGRHACPGRAVAITIACAGVSALLAHGPWAGSGYHASSNARIPVLSRTLYAKGDGA